MEIRWKPRPVRKKEEERGAEEERGWREFGEKVETREVSLLEFYILLIFLFNLEPKLRNLSKQINSMNSLLDNIN